MRTSLVWLVVFLLSLAAPTIYPLSLHDALPISRRRGELAGRGRSRWARRGGGAALSASAAPARRATPTARACRRSRSGEDRKSTRLNSSHLGISYAVFCLKKKNKKHIRQQVVQS